MKKTSWEDSLCKNLNDDAEYIKWLEKNVISLNKQLNSLYGWGVIILLLVVVMATINIWN